MNAQRPYISFVATSRNDNHGGSLTRRMQIFVQGLISQCKRFQLPSELILVEWNPPGERKPLSQELNILGDSSPLKIRIITVSEELHRKLENSTHLPLYQMIAKNVGIRRADGIFILATNIDLLFNDNLMQFLANRSLKSGHMYRIDRVDVDTDVPDNIEIEKQLKYCDCHILRINRRDGTIQTNSDGISLIQANDVFPLNQGITFGDGWSPLKFESRDKPYRFIRDGARIRLNPSDRSITGIKINIEPSSGVQHFPFRMAIYDMDQQEVASGLVLGMHEVLVRLPLEVGKSQDFVFRIFDGGIPDYRTGNVTDAKVRSVSWTTRSNFVFAISKITANKYQFKNFVPIFLTSSMMKFRQMLRLDDMRFDIVRADDNILLSQNWHTFEIKDGRYARWVDNDAKFSYKNRNYTSRTLLLELEPGPGVNYDNFQLEVLDKKSKTIGKFQILAIEKKKQRFLRNKDKSPTDNTRGSIANSRKSFIKSLPKIFSHRQIIHVNLPLENNKINTFTLHANYKNDAGPQRQIYMGFRVYRCEWLDCEVRHPAKLDKDSYIKSSLTTAINSLQSVGIENNRKISAIHTNGCGDFTLISRDDWFKIRGYPEFEIFSMHLDSLGCHSAVCAGVKEVVLGEPMRVYHIEHGKGSGWTPEGEIELFSRIRKKGIPILSFPEMVEFARLMFNKGPIQFNQEGWGLANENLNEYTVGACDSNLTIDLEQD